MFFVEYRQSDMGPQLTVSEMKIYLYEIPHSLTSQVIFGKVEQFMAYIVSE
jgi:hypothetical protein